MLVFTAYIMNVIPGRSSTGGEGGGGGGWKQQRLPPRRGYWCGAPIPAPAPVTSGRVSAQSRRRNRIAARTCYSSRGKSTSNLSSLRPPLPYLQTVRVDLPPFLCCPTAGAGTITSLVPRFLSFFSTQRDRDGTDWEMM